MILQEINLANYRGFEQIDFKFHPRVTVIAGVNGVGKSGILRALATVFSQSLHEFTPSTKFRNAPTFEDDDIQYGRETLQVSAEFVSRDVALEAFGTRRQITTERMRQLTARLKVLRKQLRNVGKGREKVDLELAIDGVLRLQSEEGDQYDLLVEAADRGETLKELRNATGAPVVTLFTPHRHIFENVRKLATPEPFERRSAYTSALEERTLKLGDFMAWFHTMEQLPGRGKKRRHSVIAQLRGVVAKFMPEFRNLRIEDGDELRFIVEKDNVPLSLRQLSDGERGILALLFDITRRLAIANPDLDDPIAEGTGLIMIDEIELHLHPKWQRDVLTRLTKIFSSCQFVVTSHSPMLLGEVEAESIRFLYHDEDRRVRNWTPDYSLGLDVNRILEDLMEVKSRDAGVAKKITDLFRKIDDEDFPSAKKKLAALQKLVGEADPDLIRAKSLMEFLGDSE